MISLYQAFILCVIALRLVATPKDRNALSIVLVASFVSTLLVHLVTYRIHAPWKLLIPGMVETFTIIAMLQWSRNLTGYLQSCCLTVAWLAHFLCYLDVVLKSDMVYSRYEGIIQLVAVAQILVCYETIARCGSLVLSWLDAFRYGCGWGVRTASLCYIVLHGKAVEIIQASRGTEKRG